MARPSHLARPDQGLILMGDTSTRLSRATRTGGSMGKRSDALKPIGYTSPQCQRV